MHEFCNLIFFLEMASQILLQWILFIHWCLSLSFLFLIIFSVLILNVIMYIVANTNKSHIESISNPFHVSAQHDSKWIMWHSIHSNTEPLIHEFVVSRRRWTWAAFCYTLYRWSEKAKTWTFFSDLSKIFWRKDFLNYIVTPHNYVYSNSSDYFSDSVIFAHRNNFNSRMSVYFHSYLIFQQREANMLPF